MTGKGSIQDAVRAMREGARRWLETIGLPIDPGTPCGNLPIAHRQLVEIAKALSTESRVLILDEPTSSLTTRETERLLAIIDDLRRAGVAVVFVSHHLDEVMRIADRVIVLRDGRKTGELMRGEYDRATIERLMVGRDIARAERRAVGAGAAVLGHPAAALAMLANHLGARGEEIPAGTLVLSGGITEAVAVQAGDHVTLRVQGMGSTSLRFV